MALIVPTPTLSQTGNSTAALASEKPISLSCGPVTFADGTALAPANALSFTYQIYRLLSPGVSQVWDGGSKTWKAPGSTVTTTKLFYVQPDWQSILVAVSNKDSSGNPTFLTNSSTGYPQYTAQCFFTGTDASGNQQTGQSVQSDPVTVLASGSQNLTGVTIKPNDPTKAQDIFVFLKDTTFTEQGRIEIFQDPSNPSAFYVQMKSAAGATVVVSNNGAISLTPANGQSVQINGNLAVSGSISSGGIQLAVP